MKQRIICILLALTVLLSLSSCTGKSNSTFSIEFIDVGQGDAALVECDGKRMLIDGGNAGKGGKAVYDTLVEKQIQKLDILAISHLHEDHFAGLTKALEYAQDVQLTICNATEPHQSHDRDSSGKDRSAQFKKFESRLTQIGSKITVPPIGKKYHLGSAEVEVLDNSSVDGNDSLVLLITYGGTKFLFTGDIEDAGQNRLSEKYHNNEDKPFKVDLIKMPHHGAYTGSLYQFLRTFMPDHVVISVGAQNSYGYPQQNTLDLLDSKTWKPEVYRTDRNGDVFVKSDGKTITVTTSK